MRIALILFCMLLPMTALAQSADQPSGTITVQDDAEYDAAIAVRIRDILKELDGFGDVTVTVSSGIVTFRGTTLDTSTATRLNGLASRVEGVVAIENEVLESTDVVERLNPALERFRTRAVQAISFIPLLLVALFVFSVVVVLGIVLARMRAPWNNIAPNAFIADIYRQIVRLVFAIAALVIALDIIGAAALLSTILGAAGIVGLAIGFAVRDTVENFIASVMLSVRQPFRPNDEVEINGDTGKVIRLTSRATILLSFDGNHIRIPNATVFKSRIINFSRNPERRFIFELGVAPDTELADARDLAIQTLKTLPFVLDQPAPAVWVDAVGDSTVSLRMAGWIDQSQTSISLAKSEAIRLTMAAFVANGISMPEPTYRIAGQSSAKPDRIAPSVGADVAPVQNVDALADRQLAKIVDEERAELVQDDLLNKKAPEE